MRQLVETFLMLALHRQGLYQTVAVLGRFSVEDSESGIAQEKQAAMFQPFVRDDHQRGEGLGVGLSLVHRICAYQRWHVTLINRRPSGWQPLGSDSEPVQLS